ncbi:MAG: DNA mismatch repair protein MutS [Aestuariivita sp.]|nr:DNA mismatch repair protein MutS [Aestuariivita sp.]
MMAQYLKIKAKYTDALLFYRMGDFYELFHEDAVLASEALDIALTKRGKLSGENIPMCGVPAHSVEGYLLTLIRKGFRVAVCEQLETPTEAKKRGSKSVVDRDVVRLITPGTLTEDTLLEARRHNFLASLAIIRDKYALAWADISTGALNLMILNDQRLSPELARLAPSELLIIDTVPQQVMDVCNDLSIPTTSLDISNFDSTASKNRICSAFKVKTLDVFGSFERVEISALGALINYLNITQCGKLPLLQPPIRHSQKHVVQIGSETRKNLELTRTLSGARENSLLAVIDRTLTPAGGRLLEQRVSSPTCNLTEINYRLSAVEWLYLNSNVCNTIRKQLQKIPDLDRALSRLSVERGGPRDLAAIRDGLNQAEEISQETRELEMPEKLRDARQNLTGHDELISLLEKALIDSPPIFVRDGGFIKPEYSQSLMEAQTLRNNGRSIIAKMQTDYILQTGIQSLKIKYNNVLGYFVETPATHAKKMMSQPLSETFIHRQTTASQVRFTTLELSETENKVNNAGTRALEIEKQLFGDLLQAVLSQSKQIITTSQALAEVDLAAGLADLARREAWCCPEVNLSREFSISGGRHPVVEYALKQQDKQNFITNNCELTATDTAAIWLLTGPNMSGKSTFLRQNALIAILAQMGSFVPADAAKIGMVSQIFSRVGASDDLAQGRSTFMVEMVETAAILHQADNRALVILDEIGRGTATYDGLSIAWATLEHLYSVNKCRALFATHYHELTLLASKLEGIENTTVTVKEWDGDIIFLHEVQKGAANRSYGVQVAKLAGLPDSVINRAQTVLSLLEKKSYSGNDQADKLFDDLPLFSQKMSTKPAITSSILENMMKEIHPDELTPREALELIYKLKTASKS